MSFALIWLLKVDQLVSANNKQFGGILSRFYETVSGREEFRKAMLEDIEWPVESCIVALSSCINRARSQKGGNAVQDALKACRLMLLILSCVGKFHILETVSDGELENLSLVCLASLTAGGAIDKSAGNGALAWHLYIILGEFIRNEFLDANLLPEAHGLPITEVITSWDEWFVFITDRIIVRKKNQLKSNGSTSWKKDEIYHVDGLAHCLASRFMLFDESTLYSRNNNVGWTFIQQLGEIIAQDPLDFVNVYVDTLNDYQSRGLLDLIAIAYSAWWSVPQNRHTEEGLEHNLNLAFDLISGRTEGTKSLSKKLSKELQVLSKHLSALIQVRTAREFILS